jgi:hypothetical protein
MAGSITRLQDLLNQEAQLGNEGLVATHPFRMIIHEEIKQLRGTEKPWCFGEDDCSTSMLSTCPWRQECGGTHDIT